MKSVKSDSAILSFPLTLQSGNILERDELLIQKFSNNSITDRYTKIFIFFLYLPVFNLFAILYSLILNFLHNRKTPETLRFRGILRLDTTLSCDNKSIFRLYYSMIVATRPDPTVRPPSRYFNPVLPHIFYGFLSKIQ